MSTSTEGYLATLSFLNRLDRDEERVFIDADLRRRIFTGDRPSSLAVRMAFWEIVAAEVWS